MSDKMINSDDQLFIYLFVVFAGPLGQKYPSYPQTTAPYDPYSTPYAQPGYTPNSYRWVEWMVCTVIKCSCVEQSCKKLL